MELVRLQELLAEELKDVQRKLDKAIGTKNQAEMLSNSATGDALIRIMKCISVVVSESKTKG